MIRDDQTALALQPPSEEVLARLEECDNALTRVQIVQEMKAYARLDAVYRTRRDTVKGIKKFWPTVFDDHAAFEPLLAIKDDLHAMSHLTDFWLERDSHEPRAFTAEFYFSENPYFSDSVLKKVFKYEPQKPENAEAVPSLEKESDGVSPAMLAFSWHRDIKPQAIKINWKSDDKNLTKLHPRQVEEPDGDILDPGTFFNFFELADDPYDIGNLLSEDLFPDAIDYFLGKGVHSRGDTQSDGGSDGYGSDADDHDVEQPQKKKAKMD